MVLRDRDNNIGLGSGSGSRVRCGGVLLPGVALVKGGGIGEIVITGYAGGFPPNPGQMNHTLNTATHVPRCAAHTFTIPH